MKRIALLLCGTAGVVFGSDLGAVKNVYLLKMSKGMDQYLANRLTNEHIFQIVTDPKMADAILTDQIGEGFEAKMGELFPPLEPVEKPAKPEKPEKPDKADKVDKPDKADKPDKPNKIDESANVMDMLGDTVNKLPPLSSSFGRAKGTLFLVDAKSKEVVWSTYDVPKDATSKQMDRTATDIVSRLKRDLKKK
jgi:hypothetical protein